MFFILLAGNIGFCLDADLISRLDYACRENLDVRYPAMIDTEHGGFIENYDSKWQPLKEQKKFIVSQARSLWLASEAFSMYPEKKEYRTAAEAGFRFLKDHMWDQEYGGFYWQLSREGKIMPAPEDGKHVYGISFGIYGCAAYSRIFSDKESLELARRTFEWLDTNSHDGKNGGYFEVLDRKGVPVLDNDKNAGQNMIDGFIGYKTMNAHIHLMESFTELYRIWPDRKLESRLRELFSIIKKNIVSPTGGMHLFFTPDWKPLPGHDSYGHDVETAYLLLETAEVLGMKDEPETLKLAKKMVDNAIDFAWDAEKGGLAEEGEAYRKARDSKKVWWTQAEFLNALLLMDKKFPDDPRGYYALFKKQWQYIDDYLIDHHYKGWYQYGLDSGGKIDDPKSSAWFCGYHNGRALMNCIRMMRE